MRLKKLVSYGIILLSLVMGFGFTTIARGFDIPPTTAQITFAQETSDLMRNTVVAALIQEIEETTPANVEQGKHSISLIFDDQNINMRLVGTIGPLRNNDRPRDSFERQANSLALMGQESTSVQRVDDKWYYRRSIPLSNFKSQCALCHTNYPPGPTSDFVGALMLRIPINN